jgi:hypothetical protein
MDGTRRHAVGRRSNWAPALIVLLVLAAAAVAFWRSQQVDDKPQVATPPVPSVAMPAANVPAPDDAPPAPGAPTDGDTLLRDIGARLSSSDLLAAWLSQASIVQRLTAAVNQIASGENPHAPLSFIAPQGAFTSAAMPDGTATMTAQSHARFDPFVRVVTGVDARRAGQAYVEVAPFFHKAFKGIARPGQSFEVTLHAAIARLLATPVPPREPALHDKGLQLVFVDPALESLQPAQKQLVRMGPENERALQAWLATFDKALPPAAR